MSEVRFFLIWVLAMTLISGAGLCFLPDAKSKTALGAVTGAINIAALVIRDKIHIDKEEDENDKSS